MCLAAVQPSGVDDDGVKYSYVLLPLVQKGASQLVEEPVKYSVFPHKKTDAEASIAFYRLDRALLTGTGIKATCE